MTSLKEIASLVEGELVGDNAVEISGVAALEDAKKGDLSFVLEDNKFSAAENSAAVAFIAPNEFPSFNRPVIKVKNPRLALAKILALFDRRKSPSSGVSDKAFVGDNVSLGKNISISPFSYVGDGASIGDGTIIHPNVTIYPVTVIGKRCIIHSGCVIGVDGFGFVQSKGKFIKIPQIGRVVIEDDVEIYANNSISRGAIGDTLIKSGTKIDNMNHIAHNVKIGNDSAITAMSAFAGSSSIGNRVQMSGQCGVTPHTHVGDDAILMARSGVTKDIAPGSVVAGFPAQDHIKEHKITALIRKLPDLFERLKKLESRGSDKK